MAGLQIDPRILEQLRALRTGQSTITRESVDAETDPAAREILSALLGLRNELDRRDDELARTKEDLQKQLHIFQTVLESAGEGIVVSDQHQKFFFFNAAAEAIIGIGATDATPDAGSGEYGLFQADRKTRIPPQEMPLAKAIRGESSDGVEIFVRNPSRPDGILISVTGRPIVDAAGGVLGGVATYHDITELRAAQERLAALAMTDGLTGLANRRAFRDRLDQLVAEAGRGRKLALAMLDIDHFKRINDMHGHQKGDQVLVALAKVLTANVRKTDFVARFGGEEFCVLFTDVDEAKAAGLAEMLRRAIETIQVPLCISASFGVCAWSAELGAGGDPLIAAADAALYKAKAAGRNRVAVHGGSAPPAPPRGAR